MEQHGLYAYQEIAGVRTQVACRFVVDAAGAVRFDMGRYDRARSLVIDPLVYSTFLDSTNSSSSATGIAVDGSGNAYVASDATVLSVQDITAPAPDLETLPDVTASCLAAMFDAPTATNDCAGTIVGTTADPLEYAEQGRYVVTGQFDDGNGNVSAQEQTVIESEETIETGMMMLVR